MSYIKAKPRKQKAADNYVVTALRSGLSEAGFQCGDCVKMMSCNKVAQAEFCLEWDFFASPTAPDESCE